MKGIWERVWEWKWEKNALRGVGRQTPPLPVATLPLPPPHHTINLPFSLSNFYSQFQSFQIF